ncbi:MAG: RNA polymerase sigma factor, partial [Clostridia bacterium]|nr:RNA polymerase sigma factor [Clostridia bacterium]
DDAEDASQNTFLRYYRKAPEFHSAEHEKAWLIRCAVNCAKSLCTSRNRHQHERLEDHRETAAPMRTLPDLLWYLPIKDRIVLQLKYVEGYTSKEIAAMIGGTDTSVRKRIQRAKKRADEIYKKEVLV